MFFVSGTLLAGQNLVGRINRIKKTIETISVPYIFRYLLHTQMHVGYILPSWGTVKYRISPNTVSL